MTRPTTEHGEYNGRVVVVTGGTNGLGRHLAGALIDRGADVFFCGRNEAEGARLAGEWGGRAHFTRCDLADAEQLAGFVREAGEFRGRIDHVVNNAAIDPKSPLAESSLEDFDRVVAVNLRAMFAVLKEAAPYLARGEGKSVVNVGSTNWMLGMADYAMYASAKSGVVGLTRAMARELGREGIRVNMVSPGWIMTERQLSEKVSEEDKARLLDDTAIGRLLYDHDVTPVTLFLLSACAGAVSGQNLVVDGGKYLQ